MVAATHGRGRFALDVRQLQQLTPDVMAESVHLFDAEHGVLPSGGGGFGGGQAQSAWVHYWLSGGAEVSAVVKDSDGETVATLEPEGRAGLHQLEWDLERDTEGEDESQGFRRRRNFVSPGDYTVELSVDGDVHTVAVSVTR